MSKVREIFANFARDMFYIRDAYSSVAKQREEEGKIQNQAELDILALVPNVKELQNILSEMAHLGCCIYDKDCHENEDGAMMLQAAIIAKMKGEKW